MKLEVLGCAGGEAIDRRSTSFLLDDHLLIDAGAVANVLTVARQCRLDHVLVSHPHLDHVKDIGFIVDNTFGMRDRPLRVHAMPPVIEALRRHYFNWTIFPDFTVLPDSDHPVLELIASGADIELGALAIRQIEVNHPGDAYGFLIEDRRANTSILVTGDTGITEDIWREATQRENLRAIFADTALPDDMQSLAQAAGHLTPSQLYGQLQEHDLLHLDVYCYHLKPSYHERVVKDIEALPGPGFHVLEQGQLLQF
jgi:ribonuclease BN (tRNA processing enzyme)